ncbi:hypothetical protein kochi14H1_1550 [Enterococcus phage phi EF14H1]|uniref:Uncharacterized protein n=3 Tax=Kochikohdavirus TaxID=2560160 RepID=A0A7T3JEF9_9CAUD|nr:hypothetical protein [Enterococcus phage PBEF129]BBE37224.1 hypothetical protein PHIEF17H_1550 [Enterococcus phage phiEF17H]BCN33226.1 hypothetical protein kochiEF7H_1550 [Enterococcus phage phi EF7H]BCN33430.1 hypothetical protein kochi14H1_1550 [Enterococcus phage phi EF14H1]BCN33634.1 hypothetical protein kochiEF19G_1550 [Enterococcus phage phi EF19G]
MKYTCIKPFKTERASVDVNSVWYGVDVNNMWYELDAPCYPDIKCPKYILIGGSAGASICIDLHTLLNNFMKVDSSYESVEIKLRERGIFGKEHVITFDYMGYAHFKQRFLKRFGNINSDRKLKKEIVNTNSLNDLERVFSNNDNWSIKIMKERY